MLRTRSLLLVLAALCATALPVPGAAGARRGHSRPVVSSVGPLNARVGDTLTIRGSNFLPGVRRNTVIFRRDGGLPVSVKAGRSTRTQIRVLVPAALARLLTVSGGVAQPTRFRVRIRARGTSKLSTAAARSALIAPDEDVVDALDEAGGAADCATGGLAGTVDDLAGGDGLGDVVDDVTGADRCTSADDGADPAGG